MEQSVDLKLRDIIDRHGRVLIDDPRRCEACLRDADLTDRDRAALSAAVKQGVCRRLLSLPEGAFGPQTVTALTAELAEQSGLKDDLCRRAVEAWAHAFRMDAAAPAVGEPPIVRPKDPKAPEPPMTEGERQAWKAIEQGVLIPSPPPVSARDYLGRFGFILGITAVGTITGTIFAVLWGALQSMLTGRSMPHLEGAFIVGLGFYGAIGALGGAQMGRDAAESRGRPESRQVDIAGWIFAGVVALYCLSVLFRR